MTVTIQSIGFKLDTKLKGQIREKVLSFKRFNEKIISAQVTLKLSGNSNLKIKEKIVFLKIEIPKKTIIQQSSPSSSFEEAFCKAYESAARQLKEGKVKVV